MSLATAESAALDALVSAESAALALATAESATLVSATLALVPGTTFISNFSAALIGQLCEFLDIELLVALYIAMPEKMQYMKATVMRRLRETDYTTNTHIPANLLRLFFGGYISEEHVRDLITIGWGSTLNNIVFALPSGTISSTISGLVDWSSICFRKNILALFKVWYKRVMSIGSLADITCYYDVLLTMSYNDTMPYNDMIYRNNTIIGIFKYLIKKIKDYEAVNIKVLRLQLLAHIWSIRKMCREKNYTKTWRKTFLMLRTYMIEEMETDEDELCSLFQDYTNLSMKSTINLIMYANKN